MIDTLIHANEVFTATELGVIDKGVIAIKDGIILFVGTLQEFEESAHSGVPVRETVDAGHQLVTPGLIDPHTHIVFAGDRSHEYAMRASGKHYLDIAKAGGGIAATVSATRKASVRELVALARPRLDRLMANGVTTVEVKSGYGLSFESEIRILRAIRQLNGEHPVELIPTFLGAHTIPPEYRGRRQDYVDLVINEMLPAVADEGLAEFCDVFVEDAAFSIDEAHSIFDAGKRYGLRPKLHADQLSSGAGAELAAQVGAISADHLEYISEAGVSALAASGTVAVLLPGAALFLGQVIDPPARRLIDAGVTVALATDCNPGTCMTENLHLMMTLGMSRLKMSPMEVMDAVTTGAAKAVAREDSSGQVRVGRRADLAIFNVPHHGHLPYHFGTDHTDRVFKDGSVIYRKPQMDPSILN
jgi:imidazolonepropionase